MTILFRVDASTQLGSGHVMRCLTLADVLRNNGAAISFMMRELPGNLIDFTQKKGYAVHRLADGCAEETLDGLQKIDFAVDWMIVDHYNIDYQWERKIRPAVAKIMVIDDLANRKHDCDILLDQNYYPDMETRYDALVSSHCVKFLGPQHVLLREEFRAARNILRERDGTVKRILIFYGGSDPTNETAKALLALQRMVALSDDLSSNPILGNSFLSHSLDKSIQVDVIIGSANPNKEEIQSLCAGANSSFFTIHYHCQVENMAYYMSQADICLGAGGTSTWERLYLGLPAITTIIADNQREVTAAADETGMIWNLGWHGEVSVDHICSAVLKWLNSAPLLHQMSESALAFMGNFGFNGASPLVRILLGEGEQCV